MLFFRVYQSFNITVSNYCFIIFGNIRITCLVLNSLQLERKETEKEKQTHREMYSVHCRREHSVPPVIHPDPYCTVSLSSVLAVPPHTEEH